MMLLQAAHSVLHPASAQARSVGRLYDFFLSVSVVVYVVVMGTALWAAWRRRTTSDDRSMTSESRAHRLILASVSATVAILFVALVYDLALGRSTSRRPARQMLVIRVTGHQWWWEVEYPDPVAQQRVVTANEIHLLVDRTVALKLSSADVIHSFWAPSLSGKKDLIPGHPNELWFTPTVEGTYRAQCAEYCGMQHANMALDIVVESEAAFSDWLNQQRQPAVAATDTLASRGQLVFETTACATCHRITGTTAGGTIGPDLTHLASRRSIAAGTLNNARGNLAGWIVDAQGIKPGVLMPSNGLEPADLQALIAYLGTLR